MSTHGQEIEAKFYVQHLDNVMTRLHELEARLIQERVLEVNIRFDAPDGRLRSRGQVLRLRRDVESRVTYKGPGLNRNGVVDRREIELVVDDFDNARQFIEALGFQEVLQYEKYRTTYEMDHTQIMLDELPYGDFVEIEGGTPEEIQAVAGRLNLKWRAAIAGSYAALFATVRNALQLSFRDLSFENFRGIQVTPDALQAQPADSS